MNRKSWTEQAKRFLPCFCAAIAILICIFALPQKANAASSGTCGENVTWTLDDAGTLTISGTGAMKSYNNLEFYTPWYNQRAGIKNVMIGSGVTTVGDSAFEDCTSLRSITIPDSVTSIGNRAFYNCTSLTSITIPDSVTTIGQYAFDNCTSLTGIWVDDKNTVYSSDSYGVLFNKEKTQLICAPGAISGAYSVPDSVTTIDRYAFRNCTSLTSITIPDGVTTIDSYAFRNCTSLTSITIPDGVTTIDSYAFYYCTSLRSITIPDSVTTIGKSAFYNCKSLRSITIPDSVTTIGQYAFDNCTSLQSVTIPDGVTTISSHAFGNCTRLTSITIPDSVTAIGGFAFYNCTSLKNVYYAGSQEAWGNISIESGNTDLTNAAIQYKHIHDYSVIAPVVVAATCTESGYTEYTCVFGETYRADYTAALGHTTGSNPVVVAPTCTKEGYTTSNCGRCGVQVNTNVVAALGHDYTGAVKTVSPTCESDGYKGASCTRCDSVRKDTVISATGHTPVATSDVAPTCTKPGSTGGTHCSACNKVFVSPTMATPALGHNMGQWETTQKPTCIAIGTKCRECSRCDYFETDTVAATGHSYTSTVVKPTFADKGYTQYICHCGDSYKADYKDALTMSAPNVSIKADSSGKQVLSWNRIGDGVVYEIHRATTKTGPYTKVATVAETNWTDTTSTGGTTYYYKVKAVYQPKPTIVSDFSNIVSQAGKCTAPAISVQNDAKGKPYISWAKISGAKKYTVYRSTSENGKYSKLGTTTKTYYTDSKASAGNTYFYKVVANASKSTYNSGYSNIVSCGVICGTPSVTVKIDTNTGKPILSWGKVDGATKYAIYRDGELLTTTTAVTYADTGAAIDIQYTYTVQALGKTEDLNGNSSEAVIAISGIAKPTIKGSIDAVSGKPVLTWAAVEGAVKYQVYRSTKSTKGYTLVKTVEATAFTDETATAGKTYYYKVVALGAVSKSAESSYVKLTGKCAATELFVGNAASGKPALSWYKVSGAKKYTVYRATSENGKYSKLGTTTKLTYTDTKATPGNVYYYKVIANASSSKYNSGYSNIVSCGVCCATPAVKVSNNSAGKVTLSWSKISGAVKYEIYLLGAEDYVTLGVVTGTSWTDTGAGVGEGRYYGVRAIAANEDYNSEVSEPVFGRTTCATPKITGKVGANNKPILSWGEVEGATGYIVYRSTKKDKGYNAIGEAESLTYEDLTAVKGKTYYYKVVAVGEGVQSAQSSYAKVKSK